MKEYLLKPDRYELRSGGEIHAPSCPYGSRYKWIGFDKTTGEYLRLTKSVFRILIQEKEIYP